MTSNMISFRKYQEDVRHNREMERLTGEQQAEAARHNVALEEETQRTNIANERIKSQQNAINATHYNQMDAETNRHNAEVEYYTWEQPILIGKQRSDMAYTDSATSKNYKDAGLSDARKQEILTLLQPNLEKLAADTLLSRANALVSSANVFKSLSDTDLNYGKLFESKTSAIKNVSQAGSNIVNSASNLIKAVSLFIK